MNKEIIKEKTNGNRKGLKNDEGYE